MNRRYLSESVEHLKELHEMLSLAEKKRLKSLLREMEEPGGEHEFSKGIERYVKMGIDLIKKSETARKKVKFSSADERILVVHVAYQLLQDGLHYLDAACGSGFENGKGYRDVSSAAAEFSYYRRIHPIISCSIFEEFEYPDS